MPAFVLPQFLLCGLLIPRDQLPPVLEAISNVLPLSYAVDAMKDVTVQAEPLADVLPSLGRHHRLDRRGPRPRQPHPAPPHPLTPARPASAVDADPARLRSQEDFAGSGGSRRVRAVSGPDSTKCS